MKVSIKTVLINSFIFVIILLVSLIISSSYYSTKEAMVKHANNIMNNISDFAIDKSKNFMIRAKNASQLTQKLEIKKVIDSQNPDLMLKYFYEQLQINKEFSSMYYANPNGSFTILLRNEKGFLSKNISLINNQRIVVKKEYNKNMTKILNSITVNTEYDPRTRPWYKKVILEKKTIWTDPYIFFTSKKLGITTATPIYTKKDITGVVGVDIQIEELSRFISNLKISTNGKVFIMDKNLNIIAFPNKKDDKNKLKTIYTLGDNIALQAYNSLISQNKYILKKKTFLTFQSKDNVIYHTLFLPFKIDNINWIIGMYLPQDDYLKTIKENQQFNLIMTIVIALFFILISYLLSQSIIKPILRLQDMAHKLKDLNLNISSLEESNFIEINEAIQAQNKMKDSLKEAYLDTVYRLAVASEYKDTNTSKHIGRIGKYCIIIGEYLHLTKEQLYLLEHASTMHDIGKLAISDKILLKPGKLTKKERKEIEKHSLLGAQLLKNPTSNIMKEAREISLYHHEKWDGTGYPYGLKGEDIPLNARIVAIADVFDALISKRCYKEAFSIEETKRIIIEGSGKHFDPKCIEAFENSFDDFVQIHQKYNK